jgi:hypothetical protein
MSGNNCPFYGHHMYLRPASSLGPTPFLLLEQGGNQCALMIMSYSPCHMEMSRLPVDWRECPIAADLRVARGERDVA